MRSFLRRLHLSEEAPILRKRQHGAGAAPYGGAGGLSRAFDFAEIREKITIGQSKCLPLCLATTNYKELVNLDRARS
jgi:hypothetical protein